MRQRENVKDTIGVNSAAGEEEFGSDSPGALETLVGVLKGFDADGRPLILVPFDADQTVSARTCVPLKTHDVGNEVVVVLERGVLTRPIILGVICPARGQSDVELDGDQVSLDAKKSITLRCGAASITLSEDGKVLIRGAHVVSQAAGINRIRGGSVQLN